MKHIRPYYFLFLLVLLIRFQSFGQQAQEMFGKNRIQYKNFRWEYLSTDNFDIYFYYGGRESAIYASKYAELDLPRLVEMVGFASDRKIKLLVYNSSHDLLQSNIGFDEPNPAQGGQTNFVKSKVEVAFRGNHTDFRKEINQEVARLLVNEMFYGGRLRDIIRNSYVMNIPQWYISGAASYLGYGWSQEMDSFMRDYFAQRKQKGFYIAEGREAELLGMSFWNFIVERYGKANMANILNITQYTKNEQKAVTNVLGITFDQFLKEWKEYYKQMYRILPEGMTDPDLSLCLKKRNRKSRVYDRISMSNTGEYVVYSQNTSGKYKVKLYNLSNKRTKRLAKGGYKTVDQKPDRSMPLVSVGQDLIGVVELKRKKIFLTTYTSRGRKKDRVPLAGFEHILDFDFSDDGNAIVFSGQRDGQSDLHYYNFKDNTYRQLTADFADDLHPQFLKGTKQIVFSSNRREDTLRPKTIIADRVKIKDYFDDYDLFIYPEITGSKELIRLTDDITDQSHPVSYDAQNLLYLSNENGIRALYKMNLETKESVQVSSFVEDIKDYDVFPGANTISYIMLAKSKEHVFVDRAFDFNKSYYYEPTERISMLNARKSVVKKQAVIDDEPKKQKEEVNPDDLLKDEDKEIDIENYTFESEVKQLREQAAKERIKKDKPAEDLINTVGPMPYAGILSIDNLVTGLAFDNLRGFGLTVDASMSDMLGNHKFNGGFWGSSDFATSNMYVEYQYLKRRVDFRVRYDKQALTASQENVYQRYKIDRFEVGMSYPITNAARVSFTPVFFATRFLQVLPNSAEGYRYYSGYRAEYVYDNTISMNMNMPKGTRIKILYENYATNQTPNLNFSRINGDIRNYQKLHRELVFATRLSGGHYFGNDPKNFLFGGVDNWINASKNNSGGDGANPNPFNYASGVDNINLLLSPFVTGVRGFKHGEMWGQNYFLLNLELRLPIIRYLVHGNISSSFFRNLQLIGFMDYGAAWTGTNPFSKDNTFNTTTVPGKPFEVKVTNFSNPFLTSYGAGLRSYLLGYYLKLDFAWPIKDYIVKDPAILVSFGHDF